MEHTGHLTGHDAAALHVSLEHGTAETAEGDVFQLLQRGSTLFQGEIFPCHFVFSTRTGPPMERPVTVVSLSLAFRRASL